MTRLTIDVAESVSLARASATSWNALDRTLASDAELSVHSIAERGVMLGAFQRAPDAAAFHPDAPRFRRISGGTHVLVGPGSVHLVLALSRADALTPCAPSSLVNRYVRPLLRAVGAAYFGRDCIVRSKSPIAFVGFAHDASSGRAVFEAIVPADAEWSNPSRASYRGASLDAVANPAGHLERIASAYKSTFDEPAQMVRAPSTTGGTTTALASEGPPAPDAEDVPWTWVLEEAIGPVAAGYTGAGALEIGGELMASRDVLLAVAREVDEAARGEHGEHREHRGHAEDGVAPEIVGAIVDRRFGAATATLFGVRSLTSVREVLVAATTARAAATRGRLAT